MKLHELLSGHYPELTDNEVIDAIRSVPAHFIDLSITAGNVAWVSGTAPEIGVAGATITAGQPLYSSAGTWLLADANVAGKMTPTAVALSGASANGYLMVAKQGAVINIGATIVKGTVYYLSGTAGGIAPVADLASTWNVTLIGVGSTTANMQLLFIDTGIVI